MRLPQLEYEIRNDDEGGEPLIRSYVENKSLLVVFSITNTVIEILLLCFLLLSLVTSLQCLIIGPNFVITPHKFGNGATVIL